MRDLRKRRVVITTGRTEEALDAVGLVITNAFTGRQGQDIAWVCACAGAEVVLVSGVVDEDLIPHPHIQVINVRTMREMQEAVLSAIAMPTDIYISVAAIADFSLAGESVPDLQEGEKYRLNLVENPSLLSLVAKHEKNRPRLVVGFAAQSPETLLEYARIKFEKSGVDMTVANPIGGHSPNARDNTRNQVYFISRRNGVVSIEAVGEMSKQETAKEIIRRIEQLKTCN